MRESTRRKLDAAIALEPRAAVAIRDADIEFAYRLLGGIEAFLAQRFGVPADIAETVFPYTEAETKALVEPTRETLEYLGVSTVPNLPIYKLLIVLVSINVQKIIAARMLMTERAARTQATQPLAA